MKFQDRHSTVGGGGELWNNYSTTWSGGITHNSTMHRIVHQLKYFVILACSVVLPHMENASK